MCTCIMLRSISSYNYKIGQEIGRNIDIEIEKSAGPSTVVLVTLEEEKMEMLKKLVKRDVQVVGRIL